MDSPYRAEVNAHAEEDGAFWQRVFLAVVGGPMSLYSAQYAVENACAIADLSLKEWVNRGRP